MEDDKSIIYNNMFAPTNCTGGTEQGCEPFAVTERERERARARAVTEGERETEGQRDRDREREREKGSETLAVWPAGDVEMSRHFSCSNVKACQMSNTGA
jgi:hypothetical protein